MQIIPIEAPYTDEETEIIKHLKAMQQEYTAHAKPFVDRLTYLRSLQPTRYTVIMEEGDQPLPGILEDR